MGTTMAAVNPWALQGAEVPSAPVDASSGIFLQKGRDFRGETNLGRMGLVNK